MRTHAVFGGLGRAGRTRRKGVALLLVLVTVLLAATLATSFLTGQGTSIGIARNVRSQASARFVAESGLELAIAYVEQNCTWRNDFSHGTWVTDSAFAGGTFTIVGEDGEDTDGDGVISNPAEGDGDLADDSSDRLTLTVTGTVNGVSHIVSAVLTPNGGGGVVAYEELTEASASDGTTSITILTPGSTNEGDLLITAVATDLKTASSLAPPVGSGWTTISIGEGNEAVTLGVWWKLAGASEPVTYQFTWSGKQACYAWIMRFTGHDPDSPLNAAVSLGSGNDAAPPSPSVTATVSNAMVVRIGGFDDDDITAGNPGLSGHSSITMGYSGEGSGTCSGGAGYLQQAACGASDTSAFTLTSAEQSQTVTLAIAPDPDGGGGGPLRYSVRWAE